MATVNSVQASFLLDTGVAVTLLRDDIWARTTNANVSQELKPWSALELVSTGGTPLAVHACSACVELQLEGEPFMAGVVVV